MSATAVVAAADRPKLPDRVRRAGRLLHQSSTSVPVPLRGRSVVYWAGRGPGQSGPTDCAFSAVPAKRHWPYDPARFDDEPDAFAYSAAEQFHSLCYVRLDSPRRRGLRTLRTVKSFLAAGFPSAFGFPVCTSVSADPEIPLPTIFDAIRGGQAVVAVGYDDNRRTRAGKGSLFILNSWGAGWGEQGFGWLPYAYVTEQLAVDFWTLVKPDWIASGEFERPA